MFTRPAVDVVGGLAEVCRVETVGVPLNIEFEVLFVAPILANEEV